MSPGLPQGRVHVHVSFSAVREVVPPVHCSQQAVRIVLVGGSGFVGKGHFVCLSSASEVPHGSIMLERRHTHLHRPTTLSSTNLTGKQNYKEGGKICHVGKLSL